MSMAKLKIDPRYLSIFCLSFIVLSLQVILCLLLDAIAYLPFFAISFAFLGLTLAGVYSYIKYYQQPPDARALPRTRQLLIGGVQIILSIVILYLYNQFAIDLIEKIFAGQIKTTLNVLKIHIFLCSILAGGLFSISFFQFGVVICLLYKNNADHGPKFYLFDLCGAACGCVFAVVILNLLQVGSVLILLAMTAFALAWILTRDSARKLACNVSLILLLGASLLLFTNIHTGMLEMKFNPRLMTGAQDSQELWSKWNIYSRVGLYKFRDSSKNPYKYKFILNLNSGNIHFTPFDPEHPFQLELYDGFSPPMLAFLLKEPRHILILFAGTGRDMIEAYSYSRGQADITGVELNPLMIKKALEMEDFHLREFYGKENVHMVVQEGRSFMEHTDQTYDAIILSWAGATASSQLGTSSYTGQFLYTKEAVVSYLQHLSPDGVIGFTHGSPRLLAVIKTALDELHYPHPERHIVEMDQKSAVEKGWSQDEQWDPFQARTFLVKKTPLTKDEVDAMRDPAAKMNFRIVYSPFETHPNYEIDRSILLSPNTPAFMRALSKEHRIDLTLTTDDKPYIYNKFRVDGLHLNKLISGPDLKNAFKSFMDYPLQELMFYFIFFFIFASFFLIITPLAWMARCPIHLIDLKVLIYFALLGLGFILVEISVMQQFVLFLGNPVYAFSVILASLLLATGLGSLLSNSLFNKELLTIPRTALIISATLLIYYFLLGRILTALLGAPFPGRLVMSSILIGPLGLVLGMLFPQGLKRLHRHHPHLIPWAWAVNGYMSIVGSLVSSYLCFALGVRVYFLIAAAVYLLVAGLRIKIFE